MNVLVLSHLYPRPQDPSFGIFVHRQVKYLQKQGLDVTVLSPVPWAPRVLHFNTKWRSYGLTPNEAVWEGVTVHYPRYLRLPGEWFRAFSGLTVYAGLLSLASKLHAEHAIDVIHSHTLLPDGLAGVYLGKKLNLPTICTGHGSDILLRPARHPLTRRASQRVIEQTHQVVTVSQALKRAVESLADPARIVRVVYNGTNLAESQGAKAALSNPEPGEIARLKPFILFVGIDYHRKGLKDLLVAFAQLRDRISHNLVVIGPDWQQVRMLAPDLVTSLGDRLIVPGCLAPDEIPAYMRACDLFALPSHSEGLGVVILEAMEYKRPVIATNVDGIPEMVSDGATGLLVPPYEPFLLAEAIHSLANDPERCREMGERGFERVTKEFTWERNASQMASIYQEAIEAKITAAAQMRKR